MVIADEVATEDESDEAWQRGCVTFDTEIHMIKGRLELGFCVSGRRRQPVGLRFNQRRRKT